MWNPSVFVQKIGCQNVSWFISTFALIRQEMKASIFGPTHVSYITQYELYVLWNIISQYHSCPESKNYITIFWYPHQYAVQLVMLPSWWFFHIYVSLMKIMKATCPLVIQRSYGKYMKNVIFLIDKIIYKSSKLGHFL